MPRLRFILFFSFCFSFLLPSHSQTTNPYFEEIVSQVSYDTILSNLQQLESLGIKEPGSAALDNTADWLIRKYLSYGYTNIVRDTFNYSGKQLYNLVITKPGSIFPPRFLIIDGHYDTYQGPGVNDNGSGVATILEIARLLSHIPTSLYIRFINFSAEEQGLIGSQHYVDQTVVPTNMNILLVFNIDEVGGVAGMINNTITCERDESNPSSNNAVSYAYTDTLVNLVQLYSNLLTQVNYAYGSDYVPFQEAGKIITGLYETNESSYPHSPNDVLSNMSPAYVTQVTKASTGAALYFSKALETNTFINTNEKVTATIFPNPAGDKVKWQFFEKQSRYVVRILDNKGSCLTEKSYSAEEECISDISKLDPGMFAVQFSFEDGSANTVKLIKLK
jgi:aminopeptidase YwaD